MTWLGVKSSASRVPVLFRLMVTSTKPSRSTLRRRGKTRSRGIPAGIDHGSISHSRDVIRPPANMDEMPWPAEYL